MKPASNGREPLAGFVPLDGGRGFEQVANQIAQAIARGELSDGDRLPNESDLGQLFAVSRGTAREAVRVLEANGIVDVRRGAAGGVFVRVPDGSRVTDAIRALVEFQGATEDELAEFRAGFEADSAMWAARRRTEHECDEISRVAAAYQNGVKNGLGWESLVEIDLHFHRAVAEASHNRIRSAVMLGVKDLIRLASERLEPIAYPDLQRDVALELEAVAEAIRNGRSDDAYKWMHTHVDRSVRLELDKRPGPAER